MVDNHPAHDQASGVATAATEFRALCSKQYGRRRIVEGVRGLPRHGLVVGVGYFVSKCECQVNGFRDFTVILAWNIRCAIELFVHRILQIHMGVNPADGPAGDDHVGLSWRDVVAAKKTHRTVCDEYTEAGGATLVIPGSNILRRHPDEAEMAECAGAIAIECPPGSFAMWDGSLLHSNYPRVIEGERVVCHITYTRLRMRLVEDYAAYSDALIDEHGENMGQMLGREDMLQGPNGADYSKLLQTFNNVKR